MLWTRMHRSLKPCLLISSLVASKAIPPCKLALGCFLRLQPRGLQVDLASALSAGLLAGAALAVILPEGFESFSKAQAAGVLPSLSTGALLAACAHRHPPEGARTC